MILWFYIHSTPGVRQRDHLGLVLGTSIYFSCCKRIDECILVHWFKISSWLDRNLMKTQECGLFSEPIEVVSQFCMSFPWTSSIGLLISFPILRESLWLGNSSLQIPLTGISSFLLINISTILLLSSLIHFNLLYILLYYITYGVHLLGNILVNRILLRLSTMAVKIVRTSSN